MQGGLHHGGQVDIVELHGLQHVPDLGQVLHGVHTHGVADVAEAHPHEAGIVHAAVDGGALALDDGQILIGAVSQEVGGGEVARGDKHHLALPQQRRDALDQLLVDVGLGGDIDQVRRGDRGQVGGDGVDARRLLLSLLPEGDLVVVGTDVVERLVVHGVGSFDQRNLVALQCQVSRVGAAHIAGAQNRDLHMVPPLYVIDAGAAACSWRRSCP